MRAIAPLLLLVAACLPPQPYGAQPQPQPTAQDQQVIACAEQCQRDLEARNVDDSAQLEQCVMACMQGQGSGGGGAVVAQTGGGNPADLAGVWVGEESSLDPSFYMSYTQYITLYPDGSVGWAKSEGGASRTRIDESWVRFRSWREGTTPQNIYGSWQSDGGRISIQWRGRQNPSVGAVAGNRMQLSGMGVLSEGATITFVRQ